MPKVGQRSALRSRLLRVFAGFDACDLPESAPAIGSQTFMRLPCATGLGGHYPAHRLAIGRRRNEGPEVVRAHGVAYVGVQLARPSVIGGAASTSYPTTRLHHQGIPSCDGSGPMPAKAPHRLALAARSRTAQHGAWLTQAIRSGRAPATLRSCSP